MVFSSYESINKDTIKVYDKIYTEIIKISNKDDWLEYLKYLASVLESYSNSYKINSANSKTFSDLQKINNEKIFEIEFKKLTTPNKTKISGLSYLNNFKNIVYNNDAIFNENWVWYAYLFDTRMFTENYSLLSKEFLTRNKIFEDKSLTFFNPKDDTINFVNNYKKVKLVSDDVIYWFPDKFELLKTIKWNREKYNLVNDDDKSLLDIEKISLELTNNLYKNDDKIAVIYDYLLKNLQYPENIDFDNYKLFSWVEAFKWKLAVCEWYVELFNLMLGFNDIPSKIIIWDVINASDYPKVLHAWTKIWSYYYDPTFDDPVWNTNPKTKEKYLYFKLPQDLFYTDRFDNDASPENLKTTSKEYRDKLVRNNILGLYQKYKNSNYRLLLPIKFRDDNNFPLNSDITIDNLKSIAKYWTLNGSSLFIDWVTKSVRNMKYISFSDENIETLLQTIDYNLNWYYLIQWTKDWSTQYVIVKVSEIEFN